MKTIQSMKQTAFIQYILEYWIEKYEETTKESERYSIQIELLDMCERCIDFDLEFALNYMKLQDEKFKPFIDILSQVDPKSCRISAKATARQSQSCPVEVRVYTLER